MENQLTEAQIEELGDLVTKEDRAGYYQKLSEFGFKYGELALGVVTSETLSGRAANEFFIERAKEEGVDVTSDQLAEINLDLMRLDFEARDTVNGLGLTVDQIYDYHREAFGRFNGQNGVSVQAWTPAFALDSLATLAERQAYWDNLLNTENPFLAFSELVQPVIPDTGNLEDVSAEALAYLSDLTKAGLFATFADSGSYSLYDLQLTQGDGRSIGGGRFGDQLVGTVDDDVIYGFAGNDFLTGLAGNDILRGGDDNDTLVGGTGDDNLIGGEGEDVLDGGDDNDFLTGGSGRDQLRGGDGADTLLGGDENDRLWGGDKSDTLFGDDGDDTLDGGAQNDILFGGKGADTLVGGADSDTLDGGDGNDILVGGSDRSSPADRSVDFLRGGDGFDTYYTETDVDFNTDERWVDIVSDSDDSGILRHRAYGQLITLGNITFTEDASTGDFVAETIEGFRLIGTQFVDGSFLISDSDFYGLVLIASDTTLGINVSPLRAFSAFAAANILPAAGEFKSSFLGIRFADLMNKIDGTEMSESIQGTGQDDFIQAFGDDDQIDGGSGNDVLYGGDGDDIVNGGDGYDDLQGGNGADQLNGGAGADLLNGGSDNDILDGGADNDHLLGGDGNDQLSGGDGNDILDGGAGIDVLHGGSGDDIITIDDEDTEFSGGTGIDTLIHFSGTDRTYDLGALGFEKANIFFGNSTIIGGSEDNEIIAEFGRFNISGGAGDDLIRTDDENDVLDGGLGNDILDGGDGTDIAVFDGNLSDFEINYRDDPNTIFVRDIRNGDIDQLTNIETLSFLDSQVNASDVVQSAPYLNDALSDVSFNEDDDVNFVVPLASFVQPEGTPLAFAATLSDGNPLPNWLVFDPNTGAIGGTPPLNFNGLLQITITASDGSFSVSDNFNFDVIPVNDAPTLDIGINDQSFLNENAFNFTVPAGTFSDLDGDELGLFAELTNGEPLPIWLDFDSSTQTFSGSPPSDFEGNLDILITATDGSETAVDSFTLEITGSGNNAPVLDNALSDQSSDEDAAVSFVLPADAFLDADGDALTLSASLSDNSALPSWLSFDADIRTFSGTPSQDFNGALDIKVVASDGALEASDTFTLDIASVNDAPVLDNALADQSSDEDTAVSFVLPEDAFSDADGDALTLSATLADNSALPAWLSFDADTRTFSGTPPQDFNGALDIKVTASDGELEASDTFTLDVTSVNDAPVLDNALSDQSSDEDTAVSFVLPADAFSDADGDTFTLTASLSDDSALPSWLSFDADTRTFSGTPPQDFNGALDIKVTATDGELEASDTFTLDIASVNDAPVLDNSIADQSSDEDAAVSFVLPADAFSDADGDTFTLTASLSDDSALPSWLSFDADTRTFSGTPPQDFNGALDIKVTATDGELEASDTFTLDIASVNDAPVLDNSIADQTSDEDTAVSFVLPADAFSDADGDALTLSASLADDSALPAWLSFDADTRTFSGTPPQDFSGALDIKVIATDGEFETSDTFTLDISSVNDAPIAQNDSGFNAVNTASLVINASDLLANDSDVDSSNLSISAVTNSSSGGTVEINTDGDIVYTAAEGFSGQDIFQYTITDGEQTSSAFVEVNVTDDASNPYDGWTIGTDGRDYIFGDLFDENQIYGAGGNDILVGGFYADEIDGGTGRDRIFGLWGDDTLNGNEGNDKIFGGAGADTISGGAGSDKLWGGWGSDTFTFSSGSGRDRIMDFSTGNSWYSYFSGKDKIQIDIDGVDSFDDLSAFASEVNGNTIFDFGNGDELILANTRLAALDKDAFTFY